MRYHDWQIRFAAFVATRQAMPFAWGSNDCCTFAADCVLAITGADVATSEQRSQKTALEAARLLEELGGVEGAAGAAMGIPISPMMAQVGDVVLVDADGRDMLAVCNGSTCMAPGPDGLVHIGMASARKCWRVG